MSVKLALLALLGRRPMYGYELKSEFEAEIDGHWALNFGQVYKTLTRLEKDGLVVRTSEPGTNAPDRKVYDLTDDGRTALAQWFLTPIDKLESFKDEFYVKLMLSFTGGVDPQTVLLTQKKAIFQKLHELNKLKLAADPCFQLPWLLLLDLATFHAEADIRWLEMCEVRISQLKDFKAETARQPESRQEKRYRSGDDRSKKRSEDVLSPSKQP